MDELTFINKTLEIITKLENTFIELENDSTEKEQILVKASELVFWLMRYRAEFLEEDNE